MSFIQGQLMLARIGMNLGAGPGRLLHLSSGSAGKFLPTKVRLDKGREVKWCSCGQTKDKPFCDGSSSCNGKPMSFKAVESKEYIFCNCKKSKNKPFCDSTHATL